MKFFTRTFAAAALLTLAHGAGAQTFLMSTEGASYSNNPRATQLGFSVTTSSVSGMLAMTPAFLGNFDVVWINPGDAPYSLVRTGVATGGALEQYVFGGGTLVLNMAGNSGNQNDIAPGGVDYVNYAGGSSTHEAETRALPSHAYLTGVGYGGSVLGNSDFANWYSTDHGHLTSLPGGAKVVLTNTNGAAWAEYNYGSGVVLVNTLTYGWGTNGGQGAARDNMLRYSAFVQGVPAPPQQNRVSNVPEPGSVALLSGMVTLGGLALRRRARK